MIGIGASASGSEAICDFFKQIPEKIDASFVVVQHQNRSSKIFQKEILEGVTGAPIQVLTKNVKLKKGLIYLIDASFEAELENNQLKLAKKKPKNQSYKTIDKFFVSLAQTQGERAIAILLSGLGADCKATVNAIYKAQGLVFTQSLQGAEFTRMIDASNRSGIASAPFSARELALEVLENVYNPDKNNILEKQLYLQVKNFDTLLNHLKAATNINFFDYKKPTLVRRVARRIALKGFSNFESYLNILLASKKEVSELSEDLLINITEFFRDASLWKLLKQQIVPQQVENLTNGSSYKIWCMACSTGQEAYSIAMLFHEELKRQHKQNVNFKIFATDISRTNIQKASQAVFSKEQLGSIKNYVEGEYFVREEEKFKLKDEIRRYLIFSEHNLLSSPPFRNMDMAFCRNLLIYFNETAKEYGLNMAHYALKKQGVLVLGKSETPGKLKDFFKAINPSEKVFKNLVSAKSSKAPIRSLFQNSLNPRSESKSMKSKSDSLDELTMTSIFTKELGFTSLYVDAELNIIEARGSLKKYLELPEQGFSSSLQNLLPAELRTEITLALIQAEKSHKNVTIQDVVLPSFDPLTAVDIVIMPTSKLNIAGNGNFMLVFIPRKVDKNNTSFILHQGQNGLSSNVGLLQKELTEARKNLLELKQQIALQNEQLQSSNEELLATNEELQSTNEEQQSTNEELHSVNAELGQKLQELAVANSTIDSILKSTEITTLVLNKTFELKSITPNVRDVFNINPSDLGRSISDFTHHLANDTIEELLEKCKKVLETGAPNQKEVLHKNKKHYLERITPFKNQENEIEGIVITFVDITAQKEIEMQLRDREAQLNALFNKSPDLIWTHDMQGVIIKCNQELAQRLGYGNTDYYVGTNMRDYIPERYHANIGDSLKGLYEGQAVVGARGHFKTKSGEEIPYLADARPILNQEGKVDYILAGCKDVSKLEKTEQNLRDREAQLNALFNNSPDMIGSVDPNGLILNCNQTFVENLGFTSKEQLVGMPLAKFIDAAFHDTLRKDFESFKKGIPLRERKTAMVTVTGDTIPCLVDVSPVLDETGGLEYLIGNLKDISQLEHTELSLRKSNAQLEALFNKSPDLIWTHDMDGVIINCNEELALRLGYGNTDYYVGRNMRDYIPERYHADIGDHFKGIIEGQAVVGARGHFITKSGEEIPYIADARPILNQEGKVDYILASCKDVSNLVAAEKLVEKTQQDYHKLFNNAPDMFVAINAQGIITNCNTELVTKLGYKSEKDLMGKSIVAIAPGFTEEELAQDMDLLMQGKTLIELERTVITKTGEKIPIRVNAKPFMNEDGSLNFVVGSWRDVSQVLTMEHKLKDQNKAFKQVLDSNMIGFWDTNIKENSTYLSPTYKRMYGYEDHEIENTTESWKDLIHPEDLPVVVKAFQDHFDSRGKIPYEKELRFLHKNGNVVWTWCKGKVIEWGENNEPLRMLGTHVDISHLKQLTDSNKQLERFAYVASHDLQEPLRTVNNFIALFKEEYEDILDEEGHIYLDFIESAGTRMQNLVKGILEYSKIKGNIKHEKVNLNSTIKNVIHDLQIKINDKKADIRYGKMPIVNGNAIELHSLFLNLISNSLKFVERGIQPKIKIKAAKKDNKIEFVIQDNGIGIKPEHKDKIFDIFSRLHNENSYEGTGIGLAHCKRIVEVHGGSIWAESKFGEGSKFYFKLNA